MIISTHNLPILSHFYCFSDVEGEKYLLFSQNSEILHTFYIIYITELLRNILFIINESLFRSVLCCRNINELSVQLENVNYSYFDKHFLLNRWPLGGGLPITDFD